MSGQYAKASFCIELFAKLVMVLRDLQMAHRRMVLVIASGEVAFQWSRGCLRISGCTEINVVFGWWYLGVIVLEMKKVKMNMCSIVILVRFEMLRKCLVLTTPVSTNIVNWVSARKYSPKLGI